MNIVSNLIVDVGDMKVSNEGHGTISTYALGSCIAVITYDPIARVGGILHFMLPESKINPDKAKSTPFMFADTGIPRLFKESYKIGAQKQHIVVKLAGGSNVIDKTNFFNIGKRNHLAARKMLFRNDVLIACEDIGGLESRTVKLDLSNGEVRIIKPGRELHLL